MSLRIALEVRMDRRTFIAALAFASVADAEENEMQDVEAPVEVSGVRIPGRIRMAQGATVGAVFMLPGSLFSDVDGDYPAWNVRPHVYRDMAHQFAARGVTTMRQAKIGPGTGSETTDAALAVAHRRFVERVAVARAALEQLRAAAPGVPIIVAGHSEGGLVASLLGAERDVALDGVVSLSGPALRLLDIMRGQTVSMAPPGVAPDMAVFDQAVDDIRNGRPLREDARRNPMLAGMVSMPPEALAYLRDVDAVDPLAAIARVQHPMLLVQGGRDQSVTPEQVDQLAAARGSLPTGIVRFAELQHFYKRATPGLDAMQSFALSDESDPAVAGAITDWIRRL